MNKKQKNKIYIGIVAVVFVFVFLGAAGYIELPSSLAIVAPEDCAGNSACVTCTSQADVCKTVNGLSRLYQYEYANGGCSLSVMYDCANGCTSDGKACGGTATCSKTTGEDILVGGTVSGYTSTGSSYSEKDSCIDSTHIREWYCSDNIHYSEDVLCGATRGCKTNSAGEAYCGAATCTAQWLGSPRCSYGNSYVVQDYQNSNCIIDVNKIVQTCDIETQHCENAACVANAPTCTTTSCNDNNLCTTDACTNNNCVSTPKVCTTGTCDPVDGVCKVVCVGCNQCKAYESNINEKCTFDFNKLFTKEGITAFWKDNYPYILSIAGVIVLLVVLLVLLKKRKSPVGF